MNKNMFWTKSIFFIGLLGIISGQRNGYIPPVNNFGVNQGAAGQVSVTGLGGLDFATVGQGSNLPSQTQNVHPGSGVSFVSATSNGGQSSAGIGLPTTGNNFDHGISLPSVSTDQTSGNRPDTENNLSQSSGGISSGQSATGSFGSGNIGQQIIGNLGQGMGIGLESVSDIFDYQTDNDYPSYDDHMDTFGGGESSLGGQASSLGGQESSFGGQTNSLGGQTTGTFSDYTDEEPLNSIEALTSAVAGGGIPGEDYAILSSVPETGFECEGLTPGYYADISDEAKCQVFHICQEDGRHDAFLCPNGTMFNQKYFVCDWWYNVDCQNSETYFDLNLEFGKVPDSTESVGISSFDYDVNIDHQEEGHIAGDRPIIGGIGDVSIEIESENSFEQNGQTGFGRERPTSTFVGGPITDFGIEDSSSGIPLPNVGISANSGLSASNSAVSGSGLGNIDYDYNNGDASDLEIGTTITGDAFVPVTVSTAGINLPLGMDSAVPDYGIELNLDYDQEIQFGGNQLEDDYDYQIDLGNSLIDIGVQSTGFESQVDPMTSDEELIVTVHPSTAITTPLQLQSPEGYNYNSPARPFMNSASGSSIGNRRENNNKVISGNGDSNVNINGNSNQRVRNGNMLSTGNNRVINNRGSNINRATTNNNNRGGSNGNRITNVNQNEYSDKKSNTNRGMVGNGNVGSNGNKRVNGNTPVNLNGIIKNNERGSANNQGNVNQAENNRENGYAYNGPVINGNRSNVNGGVIVNGNRRSNVNGGGIANGNRRSNVNGGGTVNGNRGSNVNGGGNVNGNRRSHVNGGGIVNGNKGSNVNGGGIVNGNRRNNVNGGGIVHGNRRSNGGGIINDNIESYNNGGGYVNGNRGSNVNRGVMVNDAVNGIRQSIGNGESNGNIDVNGRNRQGTNIAVTNGNRVGNGNRRVNGNRLDNGNRGGNGRGRVNGNEENAPKNGYSYEAPVGIGLDFSPVTNNGGTSNGVTGSNIALPSALYLPPSNSRRRRGQIFRF